MKIKVEGLESLRDAIRDSIENLEFGNAEAALRGRPFYRHGSGRTEFHWYTDGDAAPRPDHYTPPPASEQIIEGVVIAKRFH